jgi:hypothetical protein
MNLKLPFRHCVRHSHVLELGSSQRDDVLPGSPQLYDVGCSANIAGHYACTVAIYIEATMHSMRLKSESG